MSIEKSCVSCVNYTKRGWEVPCKSCSAKWFRTDKLPSFKLPAVAKAVQGES